MDINIEHRRRSMLLRCTYNYSTVDGGRKSPAAADCPTAALRDYPTIVTAALVKAGGGGGGGRSIPESRRGTLQTWSARARADDPPPTGVA